MTKIAKTCLICCAVIHQQAYACKRCKKFIDRVDNRKKPNRDARIIALRQAWDGEGFRCYYSGIRLVENDPKDPRYLTFDHRIPRQEDDVVIASAVVNDMKSDMSDDEFREVVAQLANRFSGGEFDGRVFNLKYWTR